MTTICPPDRHAASQSWAPSWWGITALGVLWLGFLVLRGGSFHPPGASRLANYNPAYWGLPAYETFYTTIHVPVDVEPFAYERFEDRPFTRSSPLGYLLNFSMLLSAGVLIWLIDLAITRRRFTLRGLCVATLMAAIGLGLYVAAGKHNVQFVRTCEEAQAAKEGRILPP